MNEGYKELGALKCIMSRWILGMEAKTGLYKWVVFQTVLYAVYTCWARAEERRRLCVFEMKLLRDMTRRTLRDRINNDVV